MATLTTGVVNAGFPDSGATVQVPRGTMSYFAVVNSTIPISFLTQESSRFVLDQPSFTTDTRTSITYNNAFATDYKMTGVGFFSQVNSVNFIVETVPIRQVEMSTNPFYYANTLKVNSSINESQVKTIGFYGPVVAQPVIPDLREYVVDPATNYNNINNNGIIQVVPDHTQMFTMDNATFNQSLDTRQYIGQTTFAESKIFALNVKDTFTNQNSPVQIVLNNVSEKIVDQNTNSGRIDSSAVQPKGTEKGNIGFAQAFGNTTIVGKWF